MISSGIPSSAQLAAWGVPAGPLGDPVELVRSTRMKRWHAPDCRLMRGIRQVEKAALPVWGTPLCKSCQPALGPHATAYLRMLNEFTALDEISAAVQPTWEEIVAAEAALNQQPHALAVSGDAPEAFHEAADAYTRRRQEVVEMIGQARVDARDPAAFVSEDRVRQLFHDDQEARSAAHDLCQIARPRIGKRHDQSEASSLLEAATWTWLDGGDQKLKDIIAAVFTGVQVRDVARLPRPALTPVGEHPDPHSWAQAELLAYAAVRTADWADRLRGHAATAAVEGGTALLALPHWPLTHGVWRELAHLAAYPVAARAASVTDRGRSEAVVLTVPKLIADHALRLLLRYDIVTPVEPIDPGSTADELDGHADRILRQLTVTPSQRTDRPDEAVLAARRRGPRREFRRNVWTPSAEDGPTLTAASRRTLAAAADSIHRVGVVLEPPGVTDGYGNPSVLDHLVELDCWGRDRRVADDGSALLIDDMTLPISRLAYVCHHGKE